MVKFKSQSHKSKESFFSKLKEKLKFLDPFYYVDLLVMPKIKKYTDSKIIENIVNVFFAAIFALLLYTILSFIFQTATPLVIVYSASMQPNLFRGDVIGLRAASQNDYFGEEVFIDDKILNKPVNEFLNPIYESGQVSKLVFDNNQNVLVEKDASIIVFNSIPDNLPIIHRSIVKIIANDGNFVLTKGDNFNTNPTFDQDCGEIDQLRNTSEKNCVTFYAIPINEIEGLAFFRIPLLGCIKLWLVDDLLHLIFTGSLPPDFSGIC